MVKNQARTMDRSERLFFLARSIGDGTFGPVTIERRYGVQNEEYRIIHAAGYNVVSGEDEDEENESETFYYMVSEQDRRYKRVSHEEKKAFLIQALEQIFKGKNKM